MLPNCLLAQSTGQLKVDLGVKNGRIEVVQAAFESDIAFPVHTPERLVDLMNEGFYILDSLIRMEQVEWCIPNGACYPFDEFLEDYLVLTETDGAGAAVVNAYFDNFDTWGIDELLEEHLFDILQANWLDGSPLTLTGQGFSEDEFESLSFVFPVKAPLNLEKLTLIWLDKDTLDLKTKHRILGDLSGQLFFENEIQKKLTAYYAHLSFQLDYFIAVDQIRILPYRISRFLIRTKREKDLDKLAYLTLPRPLYKAFFKLNKDSIKLESGPGEYINKFNLLKENQNQVQLLPILAIKEFPLLQAKLSEQAYALNINPTLNELLDGIDPVEQTLYNDLIIKQLDGVVDTTNVQPATPNLSEEDVFESTIMEEEETIRTAKPTYFKRNFIGLGLDYNWNDAFSIKAIYRRQLKAGGVFNLQLAYAFNEAGVSEGGLLFSGNYSKDFLFFNALKKRLLLQLTAHSDFTANRVLRSEALKERRVGGKMHWEIDWFRNLNQSLFQSYLNIADENVKLSNFSEVEKFSSTIFSTELGHIFYVTTPFQLIGTSFKLETNWTLAWATDKEETTTHFFNKGTINLNLNQQLLKGKAIDFSAYAAYSAAKTPDFEQFGHQVARNRGFKQDAVISRNLIGATLEFWTALPRFGNKFSTFNKYLYKHLRFAIFSDFSAYSKSLDNPTTVQLWSPGLGFRLLMPPAQINFDWAIRQTNTSFLEKGSQFSINLIVNSPFQ
jgi:hypothetical protein